jgi:XrtJ-associated TM-motif-TM protein
MKRITLLVVGLIALFAASPVIAQDGCINSPENPTAILAVVGSAGALIAAARNRFRR